MMCRVHEIQVVSGVALRFSRVKFCSRVRRDLCPVNCCYVSARCGAHVKMKKATGKLQRHVEADRARFFVFILRFAFCSLPVALLQLPVEDFRVVVEADAPAALMCVEDGCEFAQHQFVIRIAGLWDVRG